MSAVVPAGTGNLPTEVNSFVGRRHELAEIRRLFTTSSLVTLTGPGGVGKTRLVLRAAASLTKAFADGVWLVELGEVEDPQLLPQTVAEALGVRASGITSQEALVGYLNGRNLLLILDNCEHLVVDVARLADALRKSCPALRILATSREALGIQGESTMAVPPLSLPDPDRPHPVQGLQSFDAVSLFADRAAAAVPEFQVNDHNQQAVLRIVHQLDGVPLALELAAARLRTLSPDELANRLADRYHLLTSGNRAAPARHQTLRLCVDWSYHQCSEQEQQLWSRLAVFVGGFELDAAEEICAYGSLERADLLDLVASLVDKSVVNRVEAGERTRFRMLESLREYGLERLQELGDHGEMRERHRDWYARLAMRARSDWISSEQVAIATRIDRELPNVRAAFDFSIMEPGASSTCLRVCESLHLYWLSRGLLVEGRRWVSRALADADAQGAAQRIPALYSAVTLAGMQGDHPAAATLLAECETLAASVDDEHLHAITAHARGVTRLFAGQPAAAEVALAEATDAYRRIGDLNRLVESLVAYCLAATFSGDTARVEACHLEVMSITEPRGEVRARAYSLWAYGLSVWRAGDLTRAVKLLVGSLRLKLVLHDLLGSVWCLEALAFVAVDQADWERAAVLLGASSYLSRDFGTQSGTFPDLIGAYDDSESRARSAMGDRAFDAAHARGAAMDFAEATGFALKERVQRGGDSPAAHTVLTPREMEVATLIAEGLKNREIASRLVISQRTAQGHVENILAKLGFASRTQVAAWIADQS